MKKRVISFVLALVMCFSVLPVSTMAEEVIEVKNAVVENVGKPAVAADTATEANEVTESTEGIPEEIAVTRAQWLQLLVSTFEYSIDSDVVLDNYFPDLSAEAEYYDDVMIAVYYGLVDVLPNSERAC